MSRGKTVVLIVGCLLAGMVGLFAGLQVYHAWGDHLALHELVRRESLREQGLDPYTYKPPTAAPGATIPPAPTPKQ